MPTSHSHLSRRERQIMDILYQLGQGTAQEVLERLPEPPTYSSVRSALRLLEQRGHVRHEMAGNKYIFIPVIHRNQAERSAVQHMLKTFFGGSPQRVVSALLDVAASKLTKEELDQMEGLIRTARGKGKR